MEDIEKKLFCAEKAKTGRANCKKCKQKCESGELRIAKLVANFFSDGGGMMKHWYHVNCLFDSFKAARATTKKIESIDDIDGWNELSEEDKDIILEHINSVNGSPPAKKMKKETQQNTAEKSTERSLEYKNSNFSDNSEDNSFEIFQNVCCEIAAESSYNKKSALLQNFLIKGANNKTFEGDIYLWMKLLQPSAIRRIYNLQSKQLVKLFSKIFRVDQKEMLIDLEKGDVSETIRKYFVLSNKIKPKKKSSLTMQEVDRFLDELKDLTKEDEQIDAFLNFCRKATENDLKMVIRLIKHDLKINAGPRHILDALDAQAYQDFQLSRDLKTVVNKYALTISKNKIGIKDNINLNDSGKSKNSSGVKLLYPISPMLAEACKSLEKAIAKNPEGMYSEIKYDGERVQIHKSGTDFKFFTRNLKPVLEHKIARCKEFIPKAFPSGTDMILDSEILVVNTETGELLPFGTLGLHKKEQFSNSEVCLFVFDCIYFNGEDLTKRTIKERKKILEDNINPIKNHVQLSEYYLINNVKQLANMTAKVLKARLEGLVLKNINSLYKPGKRGWLKIKKDYLFEGQMADSADLVVLGAWFGTGKKGGMLSIFLMGSYDKNDKIWKTVTKVHSGLDDSEMESLQDEFNRIMERCNAKNVPNWLNVSKQLIPDFIAKNPFDMPVWEITGAEFTKSEVHTANGISIRFPRITRIRDDKSNEEATSIEELQILYENSKDNINVDMLLKGLKNNDKKENDENIDGSDIDSKNELNIKTKLYDSGKDDSFNENNSYSSNNNSSNNSNIDVNKRSLNEEEEEEEEDINWLEKNGSRNKNKKDKEKYKIKRKISEEDDNSPKKKVKCQKIKNENLSPEKKDKNEKLSPEKKEASIKSIKDEFKDKMKVERSKKIFLNTSIFIESELENKIKEEDIKIFKELGGSVSNCRKKAKYILHLHKEVPNRNIKEIRKLYDPTSKHLSYEWLEDCIKNEKLMDDLKWYGVFF